ncbi:hypothetical protein [Agrobacterium tumefaciens]|uniref:hypothetical protein n=1 Tax=Agrobacterium tumefaciens TaxID=358 RepID=UPI00157478E0|nr:hypothetical protein [Agrobacterium tumefaciens]NTB05771.1 hypothetical protein [Agrobacterium tumefaciens]
MSDYIPLSRHFRPVSADEAEYRSQREMAHAFGKSVEQGWEIVLNARRAVVLAEGGNGKTEEFRQQVLKLKADGQFAVFVPVEDLDNSSLEDALDVSDGTLFTAWMASDQAGYFFLDSVDEARLTQKSFSRCVRNLQKAIHGHAERTTIIISCRWSDWDRKEDLKLLNDKLTLVTRTPGEETTREQVLVSLLEVRGGDKDKDTAAAATATVHEFQTFILEELDVDQRTAFIQAKGVRNAAAFSHELDRNGLLPLAGRPKDLLDFVDYWHSHGERLGTRVEMLRFVTDMRLREDRQHHPGIENISLDELRLGAARIAAAMVLGRTFYVRAGQDDGSDNSEWLDPLALLPDWSQPKVSALLRRGLFTPASLGRSKFHHREAMEFLAAVWLKHLMDNGCPPTVIRDQIVVSLYGQETIIPSRRATAAWLAVLDDGFQKDIIAREPLVLIQHGDPGSLSISARKELLRTYAALHAQHRISNDQLDGTRLWMFTDSGLEGTILEIWPHHYEYDLRGDLIRLILSGKLKGCLPAVRQLLDSPCANHHQGPWALECMIELEDDDAVHAFCEQYMATYREMTTSYQTWFAKLLYPRFLTLDQLFEVIENSRPPTKGRVDGFGYEIQHLWKQCPEQDKPEFALRIATLALKPPYATDYHRISAQYRFLARHIEPVCRGLLQRDPVDNPTDELIRCLIVYQRTDRQSNSFDRDEEPLHQIVANRPRTKRALLWAEAHEARANAETDRNIVAVWQLHSIFRLLADFDANDAMWLFTDLKDESNHLDDRKIALSALWKLAQQRRLPDAERIEDAISADGALQAYWAELQAPPPEDADIKRLERRNADWELKEEKKKLKARASWLEFQRDIVADPARLRDPKMGFTHMHHVSELVKRKTHYADERFIDDIALVDSLFSSEVRKIYEDILREHWRALEVRESEVNTWNQIYGRAGVYLEFRENLPAFDALPEDMARKAIALGVWDYHRDWLQRLIDRRPEIGLPLVTAKLAKDLSRQDGHNSFLYYYARQTTDVPAPVIACLLKVLEAGLLDNLAHLGQVITILLKSNLASHDTGLAAKAFRTALDTAITCKDIPRQAHCIGGLLALDLPEGVEALFSSISKAKGAHSVSLLLAIFSTLFDNNHSGIAVSVLARLEVRQLADLYKIGDRILPKPEYSGGSVTELHHARDGLGAVLSALEGKLGLDAYMAMYDLAKTDDPGDGWYLKKAKAMLERDSEPQAWDVSEVLAFETGFLAPIKNGKQLHAAVTNALERVRDDLTYADASIAEILKIVAEKEVRDENALRNAFMSKIIDSNPTIFHTARENHVGQEKRPDIFIAGATCPFQVAVEVKQADYWSGRELVQALETQLVGQYLYPQRRRNGILLLINTGAKKSWQIPSNPKRLGFAELVQALQTIATSLSNVDGRENVSVFGLDITT